MAGRNAADTGVFDDILVLSGGEDAPVTGTTFRPGDDLVGLVLRVKGHLSGRQRRAGGGVLRTYSAGRQRQRCPDRAPTISDTTPTEARADGEPVAIVDPDGTTVATAFTFQWQSSPAIGPAVWTNIVGADGQLFTPTQAEVGRLLRVVVSYVDDGGTPESVPSAATDVVGDLIFGTTAANTLNGNAGQDQIFGDAGADTINGLAGNDILNGEAGNDRIDGGAGNDTMSGGLGNDTFIVDSIGDIVLEDPGEGTDTVRTGLAAYTLPANVENLVYTGAGAFAGTGNALNNTITGAGGDDTLNGLGGNDTLNGDAGNDIADGGAGNDTLNGGADDDTSGRRRSATTPQWRRRRRHRLPMPASTDRHVRQPGHRHCPRHGRSRQRRHAQQHRERHRRLGQRHHHRRTAAARRWMVAAATTRSIGGARQRHPERRPGNDTLNGGAGNDTLTAVSATTRSTTPSATVLKRGRRSGWRHARHHWTDGANTLDVVWNGTSITSSKAARSTGVEAVTANLRRRHRYAELCRPRRPV